MFKKLIRKNNKGVAMITIMITIAFLSIIATTLLFISSTNYAMKSANSRGKKNFYATDAKLVVATTAIRNAAMNSGSDPAEKIVSDFCVAGTTKADLDAGKAHYDITKIAAVAGTESDPDFVTDFKSGDNLIKVTDVLDSKGDKIANAKRYIFQDIEINRYSVSTGFENSVKTDLIFDIHEKPAASGGGGGGVGNMSMLLDSPLDSTSGDFKNLTMTGNAFVADYSRNAAKKPTLSGGYIVPGPKGLYMNNDSKVNLCGDYNVIYGDLVLDKNSSLVCHGNLTVYGNIEVKDKATLIMADGAKLYQYTSGVLPGRAAVATFKADSTSNIYPSDLESKIKSPSAEEFEKFCDSVHIKGLSTADINNNNYGLISKIFTVGPKDKSGNTPLGANKRLLDLSPSKGQIVVSAVTKKEKMLTGLSYYEKDLAIGNIISDSIYGLDNFGFAFIEDQGSDLNDLNSANYANKLMLSFNRGKITLLETCPNTTWISNGPVTCDKQHNVVLTKIGSTEFNYMTAGKGDDDSACYNTDYNPFNHISIVFDKPDGLKFEGKFGSFFDKDCNATVDEMFGYSASDGSGGSGDSGKVYTSAVSFDNYSRDFIYE